MAEGDSQQAGQEPPKKPGTITIGGPKPKAKDAIPAGPQMNDVLSEVRTLTTRVRSVEERISNLRRSLQMTEQNVLELNKKVNSEFSVINSDVLDIKRNITQIKNQSELIVKELMLTAKKEDVTVLNKYLDLWKPVDFVTQNEVRKIVIRVFYELGMGVSLDELEAKKEIDKTRIETEAHPTADIPGDDIVPDENSSDSETKTKDF